MYKKTGLGLQVSFKDIFVIVSNFDIRIYFYLFNETLLPKNPSLVILSFI